MVTIKHNLDETKFKWLWAKYVRRGNLDRHCTWCIPGSYSKKFSGSYNKDLLKQPIIEMNEQPEGSYKAIYFCGVFKEGYSSGTNYPHNFHLAVIPQEGKNDVFDFENWHVEIFNGYVSRIPSEYELPQRFFKAPYDEHFYTCRIFRWMLGFFYPELLKK
jgi:hypothetical protein